MYLAINDILDLLRYGPYGFRRQILLPLATLGTLEHPESLLLG